MAKKLYLAAVALKSFAVKNADRLKCLSVAFVLGISPLGGVYPLGWAFFISCDKYIGATACALLLAALINGDFALSVILCTLLCAGKLMFRAEPTAKALAALFAAFILCGADVSGGLYDLAARAVCSAALPLFSWLYGLYRTQRGGTPAFYAGVAAYMLSFVLFLSHSLGAGNIGRVAALLVTLLAAKEGGMPYGGIFGFVCGLGCDSATAAVLGVTGFTAGLLFAAGDLLALPICCLAGLCTGMYFFGMDETPSLIICFSLSTALYLLLKNKVRLLPRSEDKAPAVADITEGQPLSEAFFAISQSARAAARGNAAIRAADDYESFSALLSETKERQSEEQKPNVELSEAASAMLNGAGVKAEKVLVTGTRRKRLTAENVVIDRLSLSSDALAELVARLFGTKMRRPEFFLNGGKATLLMESAPLYRIECSRTGICKRGERISGDTVSFFKSNDGLFFALISDGMGSGSEAADSSRTASIFLEKLLAAGVGTQNAIALLNSYLASRENEVFATVDLFAADLYTGSGTLVKAGAAPSFVLRAGKCKRLQSATAPAGIIRELHAEKLGFSLKCGDVLVMLSDGLAGDGNATEAESLLTNLCPQDSTSTIADTLMDEALHLFGKRDDMSVCVVKILSA